jgi:hypothetical protein
MPFKKGNKRTAGRKYAPKENDVPYPATQWASIVSKGTELGNA